MIKTNQSTYGVPITTVATQPECRAVYCGISGDYYFLRTIENGTNAWILYKGMVAGIEYGLACLGASTAADGSVACSAGAINFEY